MSDAGNYRVEFPEGFADYWEVESKGWAQGVVAVIAGQRYPLMIYDPARLSQEIEAELERAPVFFERNLVVVPVVTICNIERAVAALAESRRYLDMTPEPDDRTTKS